MAQVRISKWLAISIGILSYTLNALLLVGLITVAVTLVDDAKQDNLRYEHTLYTYIEEPVLKNTYTL